jgi:hypothetical protein
VVHSYAPVGLVAEPAPVDPGPDRPLAAVPLDHLVDALDGMDAGVVAVRSGDIRVIANAAARALYALPTHRAAVVDDLACRVQIFHAGRLRRMGVDEMPLIRALSGRAVEADVFVFGVDPDHPGQALDPASSPRGRRLLLRARPLFGEQGEVIGSVCTCHDVTDLHAERAELTRRTTELAAIHRATRAILTDEDARRALCDTALAATGALLASLFEPDGHGDLVCTTHTGADLQGTRLPASGPSIVAEVFGACTVRVLAAAVHLELGQLGATEGVLRDHAADGLLDGTLGVLVQQLGVADRAQATRVTGVPVGDLLLTLRPGQRHLVGVDDDDEVTGVDVRRIHGLVLAPQQRRRLRGQTAEHHVGGVDDVPAPLDVGGLRGVRTHSRSLRPHPDGVAARPAVLKERDAGRRTTRSGRRGRRTAVRQRRTQRPDTLPGRSQGVKTRSRPAVAADHDVVTVRRHQPPDPR